MNRTLMKIILLLSIALIFSSPADSQEGSGGLVLAFDDGYASWIQIIAPEIAKVGAVATGFVNNQRIANGDLSFEDLRTLQNKYRWEIGTHTFHHFNARQYIQQNGLPKWIKDELDRGLEELSKNGLTIRSMVFPFNVFTNESASYVLSKLENFRRPSAFPIAEGRNPDNTYPASEIDIAQFVPLDQVLGWLDLAKKQNRFLFIYGHKVLPDEEFITGKVGSVSNGSIIAVTELKPILGKDLCLVPDTRRRIFGTQFRVESIAGREVKVTGSDLQRYSSPGTDFIIGQCYGMQLSYFKSIIEYAAKEGIPFYTVADALARKPRPAK